MERLTNITVDAFQEALEILDEKTPAQRLFAAIAYKNGITQSELAEWFDVERKTVYNCPTRPEVRILDEIRNEHRTNWPRKLAKVRLDELDAIVQNPPREAESDAPVWTIELVQEPIREELVLDYVRPNCRRLLTEDGLQI